MVYWDNWIEWWRGQETVFLIPCHYNITTLVSCQGGKTSIFCQKDQFILVPSIISSESFACLSNPFTSLHRALSYPECSSNPKTRLYCWRRWTWMPPWLALLFPGSCNFLKNVGRGGASCGPVGCASPLPLREFVWVKKIWESNGFIGDGGGGGGGGVVDQRLLPTHQLRSPHQVSYKRN